MPADGEGHIARRQHRNAKADRRHHNDEAAAVGAVPEPSDIVVVVVTVVDHAVAAGELRYNAAPLARRCSCHRLLRLLLVTVLRALLVTAALLTLIT